jgi:hypothetical protein
MWNVLKGILHKNVDKMITFSNQHFIFSSPAKTDLRGIMSFWSMQEKKDFFPFSWLDLCDWLSIVQWQLCLSTKTITKAREEEEEEEEGQRFFLHSVS